MEVAVIGLGRAGLDVAKRLLRGGHKIIGYDIDSNAVSLVAEDNAVPAGSLPDAVAKLLPPRIFWLALPAGMITENVVTRLVDLASPGDVIIDGGETFYRDDIRRAAICQSRSLHYVDVGASSIHGEVDAARFLVIGGDLDVIKKLTPILETLSTYVDPNVRGRHRFRSDSSGERRYVHAGSAGAGHFVRMIHRGIAISVAKVYAEGLGILRLKVSDQEPSAAPLLLNLREVVQFWRTAEVGAVEVVDFLSATTNTRLEGGPVVDDCRRTVEATIELSALAPLLTAALATIAKY